MVITREISEEIQNSIQNALKKFLHDQSFIETLADGVSHIITKTIKDRFFEMEQKLDQAMRESRAKINAEHDASLKVLKEENENLKMKIDKIEQNSQLNNLRVFNLPEKTGENTKTEILKFINGKFSTNIHDSDVEQCYRIGKTSRSNDAPRGIFIRFKCFNTRQQIYRSKKLLKGSKVVIREDLTKQRLHLLERTIKKTSREQVWTESGRIFVNHGDKVNFIENSMDFGKIFPID